MTSTQQSSSTPYINQDDGLPATQKGPAKNNSTRADGEREAYHYDPNKAEAGVNKYADKSSSQRANEEEALRGDQRQWREGDANDWPENFTVEPGDEQKKKWDPEIRAYR